MTDYTLNVVTDKSYMNYFSEIKFIKPFQSNS